jgi:ABC-type multidrug transport system fused ATPase/permease subunit
LNAHGLHKGKSTLAKILLRILDFDEGDLLINQVDIRRYNPVEYHRHITTVFQGFSKFDSTVKENVGVGFVEQLGSRTAIEKAINLAGADSIVSSLPNGLRTILDTSPTYAQFTDITRDQPPAFTHHGLSGGEVSYVSLLRYIWC